MIFGKSEGGKYIFFTYEIEYIISTDLDRLPDVEHIYLAVAAKGCIIFCEKEILGNILLLKFFSSTFLRMKIIFIRRKTVFFKKVK